MSHETLTPVPLNPDTAPQHEVVHGQVVEATSDDHGFMETALRSQNSETPSELRKPRHKREVVVSIDPEHIHLEGATATLAQMIAARELVHSDDFAAHEPEERNEVIADLLDQLMSEDDESKPMYYKTRLKLGDILMQSDAKFEKTRRRYEVYQARRDEVKLQRRGKHEKSLELDAEQGNTEEAIKPVSAGKLKREIKKLDREYLGIVGDIAKTGTKPEYLESQYAEFKSMTDPDNYEINGRNRSSAEKEAIRKLVQSAVDAKNLEGDERQEYEDHLVSIFHDYVSLSDADREGLHESLGERYRKGKELRELSRVSSAEDTEHTSFTEKIKSRLSSRLGGRAVAAAWKRRWNERGVEGKTSEDHENEVEENGQLALFPDEPYKVKEKNYLKRGAERLKDGAWAMIDRNQARRAHKQRMEQERLEHLSDEERALERQKKNDRKTGVMLALGGAAALAVSLYYMRYGLDNPFNGLGNDSIRVKGDIQSDGLTDLLNPEAESGGSAQEIIPGSELDTRNGSSESLRVDLFNGSEGSWSLSGQNVESLKDFLGDYKVKENDDRGVWGISEKYLESQGIKNPTVFETDAVKDYILQHSSLTNSSIIYPGDTIKLK